MFDLYLGSQNSLYKILYCKTGIARINELSIKEMLAKLLKFE